MENFTQTDSDISHIITICLHSIVQPTETTHQLTPAEDYQNMLITAIRDYLITIGQASLQDLARHFQIQESAMEQMLAFWLRKGTIRQLTPSQPACSQNKCSDCFACPDSVKKIYQAVTSPRTTIPINPINHNA
ncbi:FeoC-like transcriptional regulator [Snodgrassella alvi]|jgi:hypothetical protein|uniref:FeoC-like transcriptional regulator n=2 Tax=Snodgrassella alvi TaxID=1196083 RepID=UPI000C1F2333|nr:FeoC-like transcriptional regulator [Snodgrassella alvi]PIT47026.1 hypothetical protein BHC51_06905 [Snodgrassella alvi]